MVHIVFIQFRILHYRVAYTSIKLWSETKWINEIGFPNYTLTIKSIVIVQLHRKCTLINIIIFPDKLVIQTNRNKMFLLAVNKNVKYVIRDLFFIKKFLAETNVK